MIRLDDYTFDGTNFFDIKAACTDSCGRETLKNELTEQKQKNVEEIMQLQEALFAEGRESILICLQALDGAGKDSIIKHVFSGINPSGIIVYNYRTPSVIEANHDFLWRYHKNIPPKGRIAIFNRSYYEEVLVVKVHEDYKNYKVAPRMLEGNYIENKYADILAWEKYLYGNGTRIVKIFLNVSKDEQKRRFLKRAERSDKHWKFSINDIKERAFFEKYQDAFQDAINNTSTQNCPWYVLPADDKWFARYLLSEIILKELKSINPIFPGITKEQKDGIEECKKLLASEKK